MILKTYFLLNPNATRLRKVSRSALIHFIDHLKARLKSYSDVFVRISHDFNNFLHVRSDLDAIRPHLIVSLGGDGAVSHLANCAAKIYCPLSGAFPYFIFLPGGQFNIISKSIGNACARWQTSVDFVEHVAWRLAADRADLIDVHQLFPIVAQLDRTPIFCFNISFLNTPQLLADIYRSRHNRSKYLWGLSQLTGLAKRSMDVETLFIRYGAGRRSPQREITARNSTLFMASTVNEIAFGLKLCHRAQERRGFFNLITLNRNPEHKKADFIRLATSDLLKAFFGINGGFHQVDIISDRARVRWAEGMRAYNFSIDGEIYDLESRPYVSSDLKLQIADKPIPVITNCRRD